MTFEAAPTATKLVVILDRRQVERFNKLQAQLRNLAANLAVLADTGQYFKSVLRDLPP